MQRPVRRRHPVLVGENPVATDAVGLLEAVDRDPPLVQRLDGGDPRRAGADHARAREGSHASTVTTVCCEASSAHWHVLGPFPPVPVGRSGPAVGLAPLRSPPGSSGSGRSAPAPRTRTRWSGPRWRSAARPRTRPRIRLPAKIVSSSACWTPAPPGVNGNTDGDHLHAEHEQRVSHRPADVERVEQRPVGGEPRDPARELPAGHLAAVAPAVAQDRRAPGAPAARTPSHAPRAARTRPGTRSRARSARTA